MSSTITGISSMATRQVLSELAAAYARQCGVEVAVVSVGGVDAARRVQSGEPFDVVFLAADAIDRLIAAGALAAASRVDLMRSPVAVAVRAGAPRPDIGSEESLRQAVESARSIGYSTGPSGRHLAALFERWGIAGRTAPRLVQPPPGVPVGSLVAQGDVALGFQQLSELMHLDGIDVVGTLPGSTAYVTTFSAARGAGSAQGDAVDRLLAFINAPQAAAVKRRHGMEPT